MDYKLLSNNELAKEFMAYATHESGRVRSTHFKEHIAKERVPELYDAIMERTNSAIGFTLQERVLMLSYGVDTPPNCLVCGNQVHPKKNTDHMTDTCSMECWNKHPNKSQININSWKKVDKVKANEVRRKTMKEKYGHEYNSQRQEVKELLSKVFSKYNKFAYDKLTDFFWVYHEYIIKKRFLVDIASELNCEGSTVGRYVMLHGFYIRQRMNSSMVEQRISNFVESKTLMVPNSKKILPSKTEIDIYAPNHKLGIEIDGIYWHSYASHESREEKCQHLTKTKEANALGIDLLHFWCIECSEKEEIVQSMISSRLGMNTKIFARKCDLRYITSAEGNKFLTQNHLGGSATASTFIGLFFDGVLVHVCSFGKARYSKTANWELVRSASRLDHTIVGGLSKCIKHFVDDVMQENDTLLSYADRRFSTGKSYLKAGFIWTA